MPRWQRHVLRVTCWRLGRWRGAATSPACGVAIAWWCVCGRPTSAGSTSRSLTLSFCDAPFATPAILPAPYAEAPRSTPATAAVTNWRFQSLGINLWFRFAVERWAPPTSIWRPGLQAPRGMVSGGWSWWVYQVTSPLSKRMLTAELRHNVAHVTTPFSFWGTEVASRRTSHPCTLAPPTFGLP